MTEYIVYKIFYADSALAIVALPSLNLSDISAQDEVFEILVNAPVVIPPLPEDISQIEVIEYDPSTHILSVGNEQTGIFHTIQGTISLQKRWYSQDEMLFLIKRANELAQQQKQRYRQLQNTLHQTQKFVTDKYNRTQIKLAAGKKVDTLTLLEQILEQLKKS